MTHLRGLLKEAQTVSSVRSQELTDSETTILTILGRPRAARTGRKATERAQRDAGVYDSDSDSSAAERQRSRTLRAKRRRQHGKQNPSRSANDAMKESMAKLQKLKLSLGTLCELAETIPLEVRLLRHLFYEAIDSREDAIHKASSGTFRWMLEDDTDEEMLPHMSAASAAFNSWLCEGEGVFHISGNAGSGKSTLMKFLAHHPRTKGKLAEWAGDKKLLFSNFYFWNSGTAMQMSLEGLYRSILLEVSRQCPDMLPQLFPEEWVALHSHPDSTLSDSTIFHADTVTNAFQRLLDLDGHPSHRMCFFIDGLDEYTGEDVDYADVARTLRAWGSKSHVKLCVSARPYAEFLSTFSSDLRLHLHELTAQDIRAFAARSLAEADTSSVFESERQAFVESIVNKSEGVFLWARVVVRSLLSLAGRGTTAEQLLQVLDAYPTDIEALYDQMLSSLAPDEHASAHRMLLLTAQNPFAQSVNALWLTWLDEVGKPNFPTPNYAYPAARIQARHDRLREDLGWLTKGLLEVHPDRRERKEGDGFYRQRIQFFHRTARDYVHDPARSQAIYQGLGSPNLPELYSGLRLAEIVLAGKYKMAPGADPRRRRLYFNYARSLFGLRDAQGKRYQHPRRHLDLLRQDLATTHSERFNGAYAVSCFKSVAHPDRADEDPEKPASFLHWAASHAQHAYVLDSLREEGAAAADHPALSLLLSAAFGQRRFPPDEFARLLALYPPPASTTTHIPLRPSLQNDPLATVSRTASIPMVFATILAFRYLGGDRAAPPRTSRVAKAPTDNKQPAELFGMLDLLLPLRDSAANNQEPTPSPSELVCVLRPRAGPAEPGSAESVFVTSLEEIARAYRPGASPPVTHQDGSQAGLPAWAADRLAVPAEALEFVPSASLGGFYCVRVLSVSESIAAEENLFVRIY